MNNYVIILLLLLVFQKSGATSPCPENKEINSLNDKAISLSKEGKIKESIILLQRIVRLAKSSQCPQEELNGNKNLMLQFARQNEYKEALDISNEAEKLALLLKDYQNLSSIHSTKATLYDNLGLYDQSIGAYMLAEKYARLIEKADRRHFELGMIYYNLSVYYQGRSYEKTIESLLKSRNEIQSIRDDSADISPEKKIDMLLSIDMNLGILYLDKENPQRDLNRSESYFLKALEAKEKLGKQINAYTEIDLLSALLEFYYKKGDYKKGIAYGEKALDLEKRYNMPYNRRVGYMVLAKCYLAINENEMSKKYLDLFSKLNDSINMVEKDAVEEPVKRIVSEKAKKLRSAMAVGISFFALFVFIGIILWNKKRKTLLHNYEALIVPLQKNGAGEQTQSSTVTSKALKTENITFKSMHIADETVETLLSGLEKFERLKLFTKQEVNFAYLANYLNTNSKYLAEILRQYKDKTFSQYINDLRVDYIIRLLYENPKYRKYKISYLAKVCGFSSREIFTVTFKKNTGISPSYFIRELTLNSTIEEDTEI